MPMLRTKKSLEKLKHLQGKNALSHDDMAPLREEKREAICITWLLEMLAAEKFPTSCKVVLRHCYNYFSIQKFHRNRPCP